MLVILDTGPLKKLINPNPTRETKEMREWMRNCLSNGMRFRVPEIADYEVRRNLILENLDEAITNLDQLNGTIGYLPITTDIMLKAAQLWAQVRRIGLPTAPEPALDGDVIVAAQAIVTSAEQEETRIATINVGHLSRFDTATVTAMEWRDIN